MEVTNSAARAAERFRYTDFQHTGPGTLAGRYLRSFWQPVAHSTDVQPGQALPIRIMSEDFTLYRGEGGDPHLVGFRCAHRGTQLSVGWVEGDCIRCFYHGWKYDQTGQCVEQPAEKESFVAKVRIPSYPVQEYLGFVFVYLGEGEPPALPQYPDFEEQNVEGVVEWDSYRRACNYYQNLENSIDAAHVGFVHQTVPGGFDGVVDSPTVKAIESIWGITAIQDRPSGKRRLSQFGMPNVFHIKALPNDPDIAGFREFIAWWVPIDDENHWQWGVYAVRVGPEKARLYVERRDARLAMRTHPNAQICEEILAGRRRLEDIDPTTTDIIRLQDDIAQVGQGAIANHDEEWLGRSDVGVIAIRRLWEREIRAFDEGRPLTPWRYDAEELAVERDALIA